jgi:hypothetical protein
MKEQEPNSNYNPMNLITNHQTEMEFKRCIFEWVEKSEEVIKELQEKKIALRKK